MKEKEKVISLYNYISEVSKNSKTINKNISDEKWYYFLENLPKDNNIQFNTIYNENILRIKKPDYLKPLKLKNEFLPWINGNWENYKENITIKLERIIEKIISLEDGSLKKISEIENISKELELSISNEIDKREIWVKEQKNIERIIKIFNELYIQYLNLNKESETFELVLANGLVKIENKNIYYPILLKKVLFEFNAKENIICIKNIGETENYLSEFYTDFLNEVEDLNISGIIDLNKKIKEQNFYPLDKNNVENFFREFIHKLSINGYYSEDIKENKTLSNKNFIFIDYKPVIFIRKKDNGIIKAIDEIIKNIEEFGDIPVHLSELVGDLNLSKNSSESSIANLEKEEILFVKDTNKEQLQIAERIKKYNAVVVQGPPGTGKTHTIANLLGHFLSQGKNVLVTSQTKKALKVLKDKIPKSIQGLCISILDDNNNDMVRSVESITDNMGRLSSEKLLEDIKFIEKDRKKIFDELSKIKEDLFSIRFKENQSIIYNGENFSIKEIGEYLNNTQENLNKINGIVVKDSPCPIDNDELKFLNFYRNIISIEEEKEIGLNLLNIDLIKSKDEFKNLLLHKNEKLENLKNLIGDKKFEFEKNIFILNDNIKIDLEKFKNFTSIENIISKELRNLNEWKSKIILAGVGNNAQKDIWLIFLQEFKNLNVNLNKRTIKFFGKELFYDPSNLEEIISLVTDLANAIKNPGFIFKANLHKAKKNIGTKVLLNNKIIETIEECELVLEYLKVESEKKEVKRKWSSFNINDFLFEDIINDFDKINKLILYYLEWYSKDKNILFNTIENIGINPNFILSNDTDVLLSNEIKNLPEKIKEFEKLIVIAKCACEFLDLNNQYEKYKEFIIKNAKLDSNIESGIKTSIIEKDVEKYNYYYDLLNLLNKKFKDYNRRETIIEKINKVAPSWAEDIKNESFSKNIADIYEVWKWKQLYQKLEELEKQPYEVLQNKVKEKQEELKKLTIELVEKKSWYYILSFVEKKENLLISQALRGWKQSMEKIGKGTGKNAEFYRKQAREKIALCQKAVPVWIMPMNKVIDTLNPGKNKFDIIIIDEASQSDISSLVLLYMAKKVIIVGDDKQVSPSGVGEKIETQNILRDKYLKGIISSSNEDLYGTRSSLYSIASTTYQPLMLREHFRCVPEIISYSNKTSYDYKIKPLRESNSSTLKPAVISYRVNGVRDDFKKINLLEAETIVSLISSCLEEEIYQNCTFGIISLMGKEQVELIQNLLVEKIGNIEIEKHNILCGDPSYFQGDERDVIFLSMVDSNQNSITPLRKRTEGTENLIKKKYNVAVSRAKDQLWIVHSLDYKKDLKEDDIRRELLEFGENPRSFMVDEEVKAKSDSIFEEEVAKYLLARDYNVQQQWEVGAYKIDMVVSYKNKKIAVECDGEKWHSSEEQVKNDIERQEILERCGWKFIRIRGSKYFKNPNLAMDNLIKELNQKGIHPEKVDAISKINTNDNNIINKIKNNALKKIQEWNHNIDSGEVLNNKSDSDNEIEIFPNLGKEEDKTVQTFISETSIINNKEKEVDITNETIEKESEITDKEDIFSFLQKNKIEYIDNRKSSQILWIIYTPEIEGKVTTFLKNSNYQNSFDKRGALATNNRKAWRVKMEV